MFWELEKDIFGPKGQMVNLGFQDPKATWNAHETSENVIRPQLASLQGLALDWVTKQGKNAKIEQN